MGRPYRRPEDGHATAEQDRLANDPQEADILPAVARVDLTHDQRPDDPALQTYRTEEAGEHARSLADPVLPRTRNQQAGHDIKPEQAGEGDRD